jgi:hypothetical protein
MLDSSRPYPIKSGSVPPRITYLSMLATFPCDIMGFEASRRAWNTRKAAGSVSVVLDGWSILLGMVVALRLLVLTDKEYGDDQDSGELHRGLFAEDRGIGRVRCSLRHVIDMKYKSPGRMRSDLICSSADCRSSSSILL